MTVQTDRGRFRPRLGLCCKFAAENIHFRTVTAKRLSTMPRAVQLAMLADIVQENASALLVALRTCRRLGIGSFRVNSQIWPLKTHPQQGYELDDLPGANEIAVGFQRCRAYANEHGLRLTFHPDQFILLNSPRADVVAASLRDLRYHAEVAELVGADVINIHGGGAYGNPEHALTRLRRAIDGLPETIRLRLTLENDDRVFTPLQLLSLCQATGIPLVYDVHHHRCLPDGLSVEEATTAALATWRREPLLHISSPRSGNYDCPATARPHHDYIAVENFPPCWRDLSATVEVEAKAKELAVVRLMRDLTG